MSPASRESFDGLGQGQGGDPASRANLRRGVVLVNMPFASFRQPSLALGLLKASLAGLPVNVRVIDATIDFAELISPQAYDTIGTWRAEDLLADWVFSAALLEEADAPATDPLADSSGPRPWEQYARDVLAGSLPEHRVPHFGKPPLTEELRAMITGARAAANGFLQACCTEVLAHNPLLVGFTTMVQQQTAALALARRVKRSSPDTFIVLGGAACRGPMGSELLRSFPFVDAVATGEGEPVLPALVQRLLDARAAHGDRSPGTGDRPTRGPRLRVADVPDLLANPPASAADAPAESQPVDLDSLPIPDFSDYFARLEQSSLRDIVQPRVPFEASRGCWWGERQRCAFCGQASDDLTYRAKSPQRTLRELSELGDHHPGLPFVFADEIVPQAFAEQVAPLLPDRLPDLRVLYYETRPDLTRVHLTALARAGIRRLEVGIESLSTPVLKLMRKGVSALQGLQLLKWARELGLVVVWNLIWGIPGETEAHDAAMADLVPLLAHLQPPHAVGAVRLDRFSPLYEDRDAWGLNNVRPYPSYSYVYGLPPEALHNLAYFFTFDRGDAEAGNFRAVARLADRIDEWKRAFPRALLWYADDGRRLALSDSRPGFDAEQLTVLDGDHRWLYLACESAQTADRLAAGLTADCGRAVTSKEVHEALAPLVEQGFMVREGERYLSLALAPSHD